MIIVAKEAWQYLLGLFLFSFLFLKGENMNSVELKTILDLHEKWINGEPDGKKADLRWADLRLANLSWANLHGADLTGANLRSANLRWTDLSEACLCDADFFGADIYRTNLIKADLNGANLRFADMYGADLNYACLTFADLRLANLYRANLTGADLRCADLNGAKVGMANIIDAKNIDFPILCPEKGSFIGFKKANGLIVELEILSDALRSSATTRKCRCSKAKVISITNLDGSPSGIASIPSSYDCNFIYTIGDIVEVADFDTNRWNECAPGIHFFITRQEAVNY